MEHYLDICRQLLDRQIVDSNHYPCGKVDDVEVDETPKSRVVALLIGNGVASDRLPAFPRAVSRTLFGDRIVRVPWNEVDVITKEIKLKKSATELGLDERKSFAHRLISKLPGSWEK